MANISKISNAESAVMNVLWANKAPMTERQILDTIGMDSDWSSTTVKTLLKRLLNKGAVQREKRDVFYYSAVLSRAEFAKDRTLDLLNKVFGGNVKSLVSTMLSHDILTESDIDELQEYWKGRK